MPELDGLRGFAILFVMVYHASQFLPTNLWESAFIDVVQLGWCGVDLFFVLSGFLITGILLDTRESPNYFTSFYARRVLRIFPLYFVTLALYFHVARPLAHHFGYWPEVTGEGEVWFWLYLTNWRAAMGYEYTNLSHFWTLAVEEQFYLVWPAVVFLARRSFLTWICFFLISTAFVLRAIWQHLPNGHAALQYATPMRMDGLALGALVAIILRSDFQARVQPWIGLLGGAILIAFLVTLYFAGTSSEAWRMTDARAPYMRTFGLTLLGAGFACLVFWSAVHRGSDHRLCALLRKPFLTSVGKYSYCLYVVHLPVSYACLRVQEHLVAAKGSGAKLSLAVVRAAATLGISYLFAVLSWNLMEKRFLALKKHFPY